MRVGDRVTRDSVLRAENPVGSIVKVNDDYVVVRWDNLPGDWHYTHKQSQKITIVTSEDVDK